MPSIRALLVRLDTHWTRRTRPMLRSVLRGDAKCPMGIGHSDGTGATGLEPATSGVTGRRSNQLSYAPERVGTASVAIGRRGGFVSLGATSRCARVFEWPGESAHRGPSGGREEPRRAVGLFS